MRSLGSMLAGVMGLVLASVSGCAAPPEEDDSTIAADEASALTSPPLGESDMVPIGKPAGMPDVWGQPDAEGFLDARGKCGPTAVANVLRLYGIEVSPPEADRDGAHWYVGARDVDLLDYMQGHHAQLGCGIEHPANGGRFLRDSLATGRPVMIVFMFGNGLQSHWVAAVGRRGKGADEKIIVMSWGQYYTIPMAKLLASWRNVYGTRNTTVVCDATTSHIAR